jgi:glycerophosphoryl diester phosphodiesterase
MRFTHILGTLALSLTIAATMQGDDDRRKEENSRRGKWSTLTGQQPIIIGHRGASGYLPEHTLESYRRAIELGADFIEPDLVSTKDGVLIARHEPLLDGTTNVASIAKFASKKTTKILDGIPTTGFYASDFTLKEIKELRAIQPNSARPQQYNGLYEIPTFEEVLDLVERWGWATRRVVGIYPETKHPTFHFALGLPLEDKLLEALSKHRLNSKNAAVFIQSFETANLQYLSTKTQVRLVQLIDADDVALDGSLTYAAPYDKPYNYAVTGDPRGFADLVKPANLADIAKYADGIGPWKRYIVSLRGADANKDGKADDVNGDGSVNDADKITTTPSALIANAHAAGLFVHAYTFRNEKGTLASNYKGDPKNEFIQYFLLGVDGVFTDFSDTGVAARTAAEGMLP